ncbi:MAG: M81 family metallopeptidase [Pseudomonadota bacterium]
MSKPLRVAVAGWQHETNTFSPHQAHYADFVRPDAWPGMTLGADIVEQMDGLNIPLPGFIEASRRHSWDLHPIVWAAAEPSSYVTEDAYERIGGLICESIRDNGPFDAVYLDLHGAMVVEHVDDGEGELLRRVREIVGKDIPLVISLDLHANVTDAMLEYCNAMTIFRTYPHLDMAETGARACDLLADLLATKPLAKGMRKIPFLFPLTSQCTFYDPCKSIYDAVEVPAEGVSSVDFATGFPPSDIAECGAALVAYGEDQAAVEARLDDLFKQVMTAEPDFVSELLDPDEAVKRAMAAHNPSTVRHAHRSGRTESNKDSVHTEPVEVRPVVLADTQDNPGAGGTSCTTGLIAELVRQGARGAVVGVLHDPAASALAHEAGQGATINTGIGAVIDFPGVQAIDGEFVVEALGDGDFVCTGEMYGGSKAQLGPMALLRVVADCDVRVLVSSVRFQCLDLAVFRHLGVEPTEQKILGVKSSVHFRADFEPIASQVLVVIAPGANPGRSTDLPYKKLREGIRLAPLGPEFKLTA